MVGRSSIPSGAPAAAERSGRSAKLDRGLWILAGVMTLGAVTTMLDATAVNVALDALRTDLHASLASAQWVITGYTLTLTMVVPITGWAIDRLGAKRIWLLALIVFVAGSMLCGFSWSIGSLIAFRVIQGLGGGMIVPVAQTILANAAGPRRLGRVMSVVGLVAVLGPILGPVAGGVLVQELGWHWIFFVNLPIGIAALIAAAWTLPNGGCTRRTRLDVLGLTLASTGVVALTYSLTQAASSRSGAVDANTYVLALVGVALLVSFVVHSLRKGEDALLDVRLFHNRRFAVASLCTFFLGAALFGAQLLLPLYFQVVHGSHALDAGLLLAPQGVGVAVAMPLAGKLTDRFGAWIVVWPGLLLAGLGTFAYTQAGAHTPALLLSGALVVRGAGIGCLLMPVAADAHAVVSPRLLGHATSITATLRQMGGSVGTALLAVLLSRDLSHRSAVPAFHMTYWIALLIVGLAAVPALLLPRSPAQDPRGGIGGT